MYLPPGPFHIRQFDRYNALKVNWQESLKFVIELRKLLENKLSENVLTVGLAGSFGRLEGTLLSSDADYILIGKNSSVDWQSDLQAIEEAITALGASPPNKSGVFSRPRTLSELLEGVGNVDEPADILGKRMLLLLESRPIYSDEAFENTVSQIFDRYVGYVKKEPSKEFVFLLNDLIRYFRFICVNYQSNFWRQNERWSIRNLKLRHSRIVMYAGLLFLLGEASKYDDERKLEGVREALSWTPLDRLAWVYRENHDHGFFRVAGLYNVFLAKISDPAVRRTLNDMDYDSRYSTPIFSELKANSDALVSELLRFMWACKVRWSDRFFEYLVF